MVVAGGQKRDDPKDKLDSVQKPLDGMDQSDRSQAEMAERLDKESLEEYPPDFVNYGEAEPIIDRDEVWVH